MAFVIKKESDPDRWWGGISERRRRYGRDRFEVQAGPRGWVGSVKEAAHYETREEAEVAGVMIADRGFGDFAIVGGNFKNGG